MLLINLLFKNIGIVFAPLHRDVSAVFSSSILPFFGVLLVAVETLPPDRIRRRFVPSIFGKFIFPFDVTRVAIFAGAMNQLNELGNQGSKYEDVSYQISFLFVFCNF